MVAVSIEAGGGWEATGVELVERQAEVAMVMNSTGVASFGLYRSCAG